MSTRNKLNTENQLNAILFLPQFWKLYFTASTMQNCLENYTDVEERFQQCIVDFQSAIFPTMAAAARVYNIPYDQLRRRLTHLKRLL